MNVRGTIHGFSAAGAASGGGGLSAAALAAGAGVGTHNGASVESRVRLLDMVFTRERGAH